MDRPSIEVRPTVPLDDEDDLAKACTPGVAGGCRAVAESPDAAKDPAPGHIVPSVFDERLVPTVARAVAHA